ncbi:LamG-like jellyroll fold domain-containing protein [uncultured Pontibacter sp.]|uniref:LamG-like jellyroll fold domain-containing protein n=1 Tax=uncultured Pontibacter sp. TaxID=453356 RepID=UPI00262C62E3|nr:LamG-like jellyroll fold domain-containing protein [uncultured Pontibacter sp.]
MLLISLVAAAQTTIIPFNSTWNYLDNGSDQGTAWREASFNDSGWKSGAGKLGYGISDAATIVSFGGSSSNKYITTYFRKSFTISEPSAYNELQGQVKRDDGVVVYLNGQEVYRNNMPSGAISYNTRASGTSGGDDGATPISFAVPNGAIVSGTNVMAVEIHQASPSSSDIAFDLELSATAVNPPPTKNEPPSVSLTSPANGTSMELGSTTTLEASASDPENALAKVTFLVNGSAIGEDNSSPYRLSWSPAAAGTYTLTATATDAEGASATSSAVSITVTKKPDEPTSEGFKTITRLEPVPVSTSTGEKPQSKVWKHDGKHWAVLPNSSGTYLWRLDGTSWTNVLKLSTKSTSKADCKMVGNTAHILLYQGRSSQMVSIEYLPAEGTYQLWSKRTSTVGLSFESGVETATIDIDSKGRMWLASDASSTIHVRWSDSPYNKWSSPITIASGVSSDDICALTSMPGNIGVLWSNQSTKRFGFKVHADGADPASWSSDEVPASQSAMNIGGGMADDHLNMAISSNGTLYCAVKTGYDSQNYPSIALLVRRPSGSWDNLYTVANGGTRPLVILNEAEGKVRVVYTSSDSGGNILYRESSMSSISFGSQMTLISGSSYNNATSTKDNFTDDIVILASSSSEAAGVLATDASSPTPILPGTPSLVSPADLATGVSVAPSLSWNSASHAATYQVQVAASSDFSSTAFNQSNITGTSVTATGLTQNTTYYWRARASNTAGTGNWSSTWSFTTNSATPPPPPPTTEGLVAHWKMNEGSGTTVSDATGNGNDAQTVGSPSWTTGVDGTALQLNGSNQYAAAPDTESLDITETITLSAWIKPQKTGTQYIIKKAVNNSIDGYELGLSSSGSVFFRINQASSGNTYRLNSSTDYPSNGTTWMHVAATYDGSVLKLYLNGAENASQTLSSPQTIAINTQAVHIGAQDNGTYKFRGAIDDARIYNNALSASEVSALYTGNASLAASATSSATALLPPSEQMPSMEVYPNPFTSTATLNFILPESGSYSLSLYDSKGALIDQLQQGYATAGENRALELRGQHLAKGLYFIRLQTATQGKTLRLVLDK